MIKSRKKYLIDKRFQLGFIYKFMLLALVNISSFYFINHLFFSNLFNKGNELGLDKGHPYFLFLNDQQSLMLYYFIIISIINFGLITCYGIFFSHKIAGPLKRLSQMLKGVKEVDDFSKVTFRKGDYVGELETEFNNAISRIKSKK